MIPKHLWLHLALFAGTCPLRHRIAAGGSAIGGGLIALGMKGAETCAIRQAASENLIDV
jgi:hypothetical protein